MADMVLVLCILMSAYFIRGITGFGSALISVPLLALSQPLQFAVPLVLALDFTASLVLGGTNRKKANWGEIKILLPFGMVGRLHRRVCPADVSHHTGAADAGCLHHVLRLPQHFRHATRGKGCRGGVPCRPAWPAAPPARYSAPAVRPTSCT